MLANIFEAALRSIVMAIAVWASIRALRIHHVSAQRGVWVMVLVSAVIMPFAMLLPLPAFRHAVKIPLRASMASPDLPSSRDSKNESGLRVAQRQTRDREQPKPSPAHFSDDSTWPGSFSAEPVRVIVRSVPTPQKVQIPVSSAHPRDLQLSWKIVRSAAYKIYAIVAAILIVRVATALILAVGITFRSKRVDASELTGILAPAREAVLLHVRVSRRLRSPVTVGSTILLPADYRQWSTEKLRVVLAHEQSHVHQRDFYLQLAAQVHAAIFWFSPLGWWLKRKLTDLGEALSDCAGLAQARSSASYAQILLEFAALPRTTLTQVPIGVAMARRSNLSDRIERILNQQRFRSAFLASRRSIALTGLIVFAVVPLSMLATVAGIRIVPAVQAAQTQGSDNRVANTSLGGGSSQSSTLTQVSGSASSQITSSEPLSTTEMTGQFGQATGAVSAQVTTVQSNETGQSPDLAPPAPPRAPVAPEPPDAEDEQGAAPQTSEPRLEDEGFAASYSYGKDGSFAIVGGKSSTVTLSGNDGEALEAAKKKYHSHFIWFMRDGKSYVITDPNIVAQGEALFKEDPTFGLRKRQLDQLQAKLNAEMARLQPEIDKASKPSPEFEAEMALLKTQLAKLDTEKIKQLTADIDKQMKDKKLLSDAEIQELTQEKLGELQSQIGEIQGQIGEIQGKIGERRGVLGETQGEIGERMGKVGEEMGRIGEEEGRRAEEAQRKMRSMLDQAVREGKAKPID